MKITAAESLVMEALWRGGGAIDVERVRETLPDEGWTDATIRTLLNRLAKKKAVAIVKDGRRVLYRPVLDKADYAHAESRSLINRLFGGEIEPFIAQFSERKDLSEADIAKMRDLIDRLGHDQ